MPPVYMMERMSSITGGVQIILGVVLDTKDTEDTEDRNVFFSMGPMIEMMFVFLCVLRVEYTVQ
jgi:hypothetical protein